MLSSSTSGVHRARTESALGELSHPSSDHGESSSSFSTSPTNSDASFEIYHDGSSSLPLRSKNPTIKSSEMGAFEFCVEDGSKPLLPKELNKYSRNQIIVLMVSMGGRTFDPTSKAGSRDNFYPDRFAAYYESARKKSLPRVVGLAEQWLNIMRALLPVGSNHETILVDMLKKTGAISGAVNKLKQETYLTEAKRREIPIERVEEADEDQQDSVFKELTQSSEWAEFAVYMKKINITVPQTPNKIREPEPDFSWRGFINIVDTNILKGTQLSADAHALKEKVSVENLQKLVDKIKETGLSEEWAYFLLATYSNNIDTLKKLKQEWHYYGETQDNPDSIKHYITQGVRSLTNGQALYAAYMVIMSRIYQKLDWFDYRNKFVPVLPITAFGTAENWDAAAMSPEYDTEYKKYCKTMQASPGLALDQSVTKALDGGGYYSSTEYSKNAERALTQEQKALLDARISFLTLLHQVRETVMVLALPHFMPYKTHDDPSEGKRRPMVFYPHKEPLGWKAPAVTIYNYFALMDKYEEEENLERLGDKRAGFGVIKPTSTPALAYTEIPTEKDAAQASNKKPNKKDKEPAKKGNGQSETSARVAKNDSSANRRPSLGFTTAPVPQASGIPTNDGGQLLKSTALMLADLSIKRKLEALDPAVFTTEAGKIIMQELLSNSPGSNPKIYSIFAQDLDRLPAAPSDSASQQLGID